MDVPEQEIIRQSLGDTIEGVGNEVEVVQSADCGLTSKACAVNFKGDTSGEHPATNVMQGEFLKSTHCPKLVGNRQKSRFNLAGAVHSSRKEDLWSEHLAYACHANVTPWIEVFPRDASKFVMSIQKVNSVTIPRVLLCD